MLFYCAWRYLCRSGISELASDLSASVLWELLQLLQPIAFKIPVHLGMVSYTINSIVKCVFALLFSILTSGW